MRYLSHLPVTCEFQIAELALRPPIVSNETLSFFRDEIDKRHKIRQKRLREERQRSRKIRINENKKMGICEYVMHLIFKIFSIMDVLYGGRKD